MRPAGAQEVKHNMPSTTCPACGIDYGPLDDMRFRSGNWVDKKTGEEYDQVCERCHREGRVTRAK